MTVGSHLSSPHDDLLAELQQLGLSVGRSKSGKLLRVDFRPATSPPNPETVLRVLDCVSLRELYFGDVFDINQFAVSLSRLGHLQVLDVAGSDFADASLTTISELPRLQVLNVRGTAVSAEQVARLRKKMINTRIIGP